MRKISTEDVFKMARLMKNGNVLQNIKDAFEKGRKKGADTEKIGMEAFLDILCSCSEEKIENQLYELLAGICEKTPENIKNQSLEVTIEDIQKICRENNIVNFLKSASGVAEKIQK